MKTENQTAERTPGSLHPAGSAFQVWFEAQHGKRPNVGNVTDDKLREMITLGDGAARELYSRTLYDAKRTSALYAWKAKDVESKIMRRMPNDQAQRPLADSDAGRKGNRE